MNPPDNKFTAQVPQLNLAESGEMLSDFSREAQRHLMSARNSILVLESVPSDKESIDNIFKTFHTVKGLSDFLNLKDINALTHEAEAVLDLMRKNLVHFEGDAGHAVIRAIDSLQRLLELLDEQLSNQGQLTSAYYDVGDVVHELHQLTQVKPAGDVKPAAQIKVLQTINFEPDMTLCTSLGEKLKATPNNVSIDKATLERLLHEFRLTTDELKETQSKLQERQRALIKERELAIKLTQQAQSEARAKSEYLANMSHEIRTLINAILGFTDLLKDSPLSAKQKEHLNTIMLSGKMLLEIVNNILDYSKVEAGKLKLENIELRLDHIVEDVFKIIRTRLNGKPVHLYFNIAPDVPRAITGDPTRLKQVFLNLLDNAIKFTDQGEIGMNVALNKDTPRVGDKVPVQFTIKDTGIGIPEDRRNMIFESYTQADPSTTRLYGGTGLGLTLCKNLIETMGGKIWVESGIGKGSEFNFVIPLKELPNARREEPLSIVPGLEGKQILIVDNHDKSAQALLAFCQSMKMQTYPLATNTKQATELLLHHKTGGTALPDMMFIDVMLTDKEGFNLAYKLKQQERYRSIKLVAVSSDVRVDGAEDFRTAGFDDFLPKPIIRKEFLHLVERVFGHEAKSRPGMTRDMVESISCEGIRVLVAEDSIPNQELLKVHFESLGCVCEYVSNGQEAVEKLRAMDFDICFMDLQMPVMGGVDATKAIRTELKKTVPIIALTAAEADEERDKCVAAGMSDYLPKPFDVAQLKEKIIRHAKM